MIRISFLLSRRLGIWDPLWLCQTPNWRFPIDVVDRTLSPALCTREISICHCIMLIFFFTMGVLGRAYTISILTRSWKIRCDVEVSRHVWVKPIIYMTHEWILKPLFFSVCKVNVRLFFINIRLLVFLQLFLSNTIKYIVWKVWGAVFERTSTHKHRTQHPQRERTKNCSLSYYKHS